MHGSTALATTVSRTIIGLATIPICVEVHISNGLPAFSMVGLPETAVRESKERVRSAIINSGFEFPARRITVNLAPGDLRKEGTRFDLAIAVGILIATGQCADNVESYEFIGELALSGEIRSAGMALPIAAGTAGAGQRRLIAAPADAREAAHLSGLEALSAANLSAAIDHLNGAGDLERAAAAQQTNTQRPLPDMRDVRGQFHARRALEIAASGGHHLIFIGPPGSGKTMLAQRLAGLLPQLSDAEKLEQAIVRSAAGLEVDMNCARPFRAPHHSASAAAIVGGGRHAQPGEISLAHRGVLFLDELPEFDRRTLEMLREPLESKEICISRVHGTFVYPAQFQLVAAMNPCPCGYWGHSQIECTCTSTAAQRYRNRISGPLMDRFDLQVTVAQESNWIGSAVCAEASPAIARRVALARQRQLGRQNRVNSELDGQSVIVEKLSPAAQELLALATEKLALTARGAHKIARVAMTIADLADCDVVDSDHIAQALNFRGGYSKFS
ncbi:MAG: YifB family Mg chelatase-like AAA ATPase [Pseudomonadota bacterium]